MLITLFSAQACLAIITDDATAAATTAPATTPVPPANQANAAQPMVEWPVGVDPLKTVVFLVGNQTINMDRSLAVKYFNFIEQLHSEGDLDDKAMIPLDLERDLDSYKVMMNERGLKGIQLADQFQEDLEALIKWITEFEENNKNAREVFDKREASGAPKKPQVTLGMALIADNLNLQQAKEAFYQELAQGLPYDDYYTIESILYNARGLALLFTEYNPKKFYNYLIQVSQKNSPEEFKKYIDHVQNIITKADLTNSTPIPLSEMKNILEKIPDAGKLLMHPVSIGWREFTAKRRVGGRHAEADEFFKKHPNIPLVFDFGNETTTIDLFGCNGFTPDSVLPPATHIIIKGDNLTSIGDGFLQGSPAKRVTIKGDRITSIGDKFLYQSYALESLDLPPNIETMGDNCLTYARKLRFLKLPTKLIGVGATFLCLCTSLEDVKLPPNFMYAGVEFLYDCPLSAFLVLPDSLITLGDYSLAGAKNLKSVDLPPRLTNVGKGLFDRSHEELVVRAYRTMPAWNVVQEQLGERLQEIPVQQTNHRR